MRGSATSGTRRSTILMMAVALAIAALAAHAVGPAAANPFGAPKTVTNAVPNAAPDSQIGGIIGWLLVKQSEFYRHIAGAVRAAKSDGSAIWTLLGLSFAYGIFHAAGPGHGKAVISSYLVANEETARRGIVLSFVSALVQALVAIAIVGIGAAILNVTAGQMCGAERVVQIVSFGLIALFGARLVWSKGGGFFRAVNAWYGDRQSALVPAIAMTTVAGPVPPDLHRHDDGHGHGQHAHQHHVHHASCGCGNHHHHDDHGHAGHGHRHDHVHDEHCGCSHGPDPSELAGPGGWSRGLGAVLTVGIRPCSGAILVLVFALSQGLFWAGVAATLLMGLGTAITVAAIAILAVSAKGVARRLTSGSEGSGAVILRGMEFGAASLVMLFGIGLLLGYVAAERVTCF